MNITKEKNRKPLLLASVYAVCISLILSIIKGVIFFLTGSTAVLATLVDSIIDVFVSGFLFYGIYYALRPADEDHRHGHGKMEGLASFVQSIFMFGAGLFVIIKSIEKFLEPTDIQNHLLAITILAISILLSASIIFVQRRVLKNNQSLILEADSAHYKTDLFLNVSVILSLVISFLSGPNWIDPLVALFIAGYFFYTAITIGRESINILMDRELSDEVRNQIAEITQGHEGILDFHDLRTRHCGMHYHITMDVELDKTLTLENAHNIVRGLDKKIIKAFPQAEVVIHMDPEGDTDDLRHKDLRCS
ncbi:MAG: cation diffusion facilitator family transporter [Pseudomonadota bacterium]